MSIEIKYYVRSNNRLNLPFYRYNAAKIAYSEAIKVYPEVTLEKIVTKYQTIIVDKQWKLLESHG